MKKIAIVLFVAAAALAGCGKKNPPAQPTPAAGSAMGGDMGSGAPAGSGGGDMGSGM